MASRKKLQENYNSNPNLKRVGVDIQFTAENVEEYLKCKKDPVYFANNYIKVITLDHGLQNITLYDYQKKLLRTFSKNRFTIVKYPRQSGKCVVGDSIITIKNKQTGEIKHTSIGEFYDSV